MVTKARFKHVTVVVLLVWCMLQLVVLLGWMKSKPEVIQHQTEAMRNDPPAAVAEAPPPPPKPQAPKEPPTPPAELPKVPDGYDMIDIGSSKGEGSINFLAKAVDKLRFARDDAATKRLLDARTLGLDYAQDKVDACNEAQAGTRNDCRLFDILTMAPEDLAGERTLSGNTYWHVLEHIPDCDMAAKMWAKAAAFSRRFSSFHGPAYDRETTGAGEKPAGIHRFWENWSGHTCHFNSTMLDAAIRSVPKTRAHVVFNYGEIRDTAHGIMVPADAPENSHHYDPGTMSEKELKGLDAPLYEEMRACAIYDDPSEPRLSLYSALCLRDAFTPLARMRKQGKQVAHCRFGDFPGLGGEECAAALEKKFREAIEHWEKAPTADVLKSI